jgi:hypothetical protein
MSKSKKNRSKKKQFKHDNKASKILKVGSRVANNDLFSLISQFIGLEQTVTMLGHEMARHRKRTIRISPCIRKLLDFVAFPSDDMELCLPMNPKPSLKHTLIGRGTYDCGDDTTNYFHSIAFSPGTGKCNDVDSIYTTSSGTSISYTVNDTDTTGATLVGNFQNSEISTSNLLARVVASVVEVEFSGKFSEEGGTVISYTEMNEADIDDVSISNIQNFETSSNDSIEPGRYLLFYFPSDEEHYKYGVVGTWASAVKMLIGGIYTGSAAANGVLRYTVRNHVEYAGRGTGFTTSDADTVGYQAFLSLFADASATLLHRHEGVDFDRRTFRKELEHKYRRILNRMTL